ncbi:S9 family peptidase [Pleionea sp. CnH1-48]|uniref:alpha/beta hydrolase family protein n=1 Tax=Pleionea sp. CnH1-48 TaxID=2954494 RepID=UPI0020978E4D|nr:alpha/beta fold hydrolase [Pleionea sp. CnH1-48]MCO7224312.1 alpha/beta fold hydrolase [Pleionea sp. CnH1-48]
MGIKLKIAAVGAVILGGYFLWDKEPQEEAVDTSYNGAYRFPDGKLVTISPSTATKMRVLHKNGDVQSLYHDGKGVFQAANGFRSKKTVATGSFVYSEKGLATGANWVEQGNSISVERVGLRHEEMMFQSGDLKLRGKLTLPEGEGPFPVVILIHGSESYSAVDYYALPYLLAANGIAGFKFDKRGTGQSEGEYTQHFPTLSGDVVAAAELLKARNDIDPERINLAGFSQGGWIAPLVAKQIDIQSIMVGFGCAVSVPREDRWGYVYQLLDKGFGEKEIAVADEMNEQLDAILESGDDAAWDRLFALRNKHIDDDWFRAIVGSDSLLGTVAGKATQSGAFLVPDFGWKLYFDWKRGDGPNFNRSYNPQETLEDITTPSLWLLAGEDSSIPTGETTEVLEALSKKGKPIEYKVYQGAEHGNVLFTTNEQGKRTYTGYAPEYLSDVVEWFKVQNDI